MSSKKGLKMDAFVASVRPDPNDSEQVQLLQGYLGQSNLDGHIRVYFDEALNNFVEVPENGVLHALPCDKSENALGGCRLWVKKSAVVTFGDPKAANRLKSSFLEGDLITAYGNLGINPQGLTPVPTGPFTTTTINTTTILTTTRPPVSFVDGCPSMRIPCFSQNNLTCPVTQNGTFCKNTVNPAFCPDTRITLQKPTCLNTCNVPDCFQLKTLRNPECFIVRTVFEPQCLIRTTPACPIDWTTPINPTPVINVGQIGGQLGTQFRGAFNPYNY